MTDYTEHSKYTGKGSAATYKVSVEGNGNRTHLVIKMTDGNWDHSDKSQPNVSIVGEFEAQELADVINVALGKKDVHDSWVCEERVDA